VYRKVKDYYNDDPKNPGCCEDGFDMRKPMSRDKKREHVRENGENYTVNPEDIYG
jgi:N-terminal acetyltransferase B complex catalytic subunit